MLKRWKKAAAFLLSFVMVLSLIPAFGGIALAEGEGNDEEVVDYEFPNDRVMLPGWDGTIDNNYDVFVKNQEYPDGTHFRYQVTDVKIAEGSDDIFGEFKKDYENDDPSSENFWWYFRLKEDVLGTGFLDVSYLDINGNPQVHQVKITAADDVYNVYATTGTVSNIALPGKEVPVSAVVDHQNKEGHQPTDNVTYFWELLDGGSEWATLSRTDGDSVTVRMKALQPDEVSRHSQQNFRLKVTAFEGEDGAGNPIERASNEIGLERNNSYPEILPFALEPDLAVGEKREVNMTLRKYQADFPGEGYVLCAAHYRWYYDPEAIRVTDSQGNIVGNNDAEGNYNDSEASYGGAGGCKFFIERLDVRDTGIHVEADYTEPEVGAQGTTARDYWFNRKEYKVWFEDPGDHRLFNDEQRTVILNLEQLKNDPGLDWEIGVLGIGFWKYGSDPQIAGNEFIEFEEGKEYTKEDVPEGIRFVLDGAKIYEKMAAYGQNQLFMHTDIGTMPDDPTDPEARGIWLCSADIDYEVRETRIDYEMEQDRSLLPGWDGTVRMDYDVRVESGEYPEGRNFRYPVTNVEVVAGAELLEFHKDYKDGDPSSEDYWWYYRAKDGMLGTATLKVSYKDIQGKDQSYTFNLYIGEDVYDISLDTDNGSTAALPGAERNFIVEVFNHHYDPVTREYTDANLTDQMTYEWKLGGDGEAYADLVSEGKSIATLKVKERGGWFWYEFPVAVTVKNGSEVIGDRDLWILAADGYYETWPVRISEIKPGETDEVFAEERLYSQEFPELYPGDPEDTRYQVVENVHFRWEYDPNAIEIRDANGKVVGNYDDQGNYIDSEASSGTTQGFKITRLTNWDTDFCLIAEWNREVDDEEGNIHYEWTEDRTNYHFGRINMEFWFEDFPGYAVFTDGSRTAALHLSDPSILDKPGWSIEYEVYGGKWGEAPNIPIPGECFTANGAEITLHGKALKDTGAEYLNVRAYLKSGGNIVEESQMDNLEIREPDESYNGYRAGEDYHQPVLPGDFGNVAIENWAWVRNTEFPEGKDVPYYVTNVVIKEDPDHVIKSLEKNGDVSWHYETNETFGRAILNVTFVDLHGQEQHFDYYVDIVLDQYFVHTDSADRRFAGFPGESITLFAEAEHLRYNEETHKTEPVPTKDAIFEWSLDDYSKQFADLELSNNGAAATVIFKTGCEEFKDPNFGTGIHVETVMFEYENGKKVERARTGMSLNMSNHYQKIVPEKLEDNVLPIGFETIEFFTVRDYWIRYPGEKPEDQFKKIKNVTFKVGPYDENEFEILRLDGSLVKSNEVIGENEDQVFFRIKPLKGEGSYFTLIAEWEHGSVLRSYGMEFYEAADYTALDKAVEEALSLDGSLYTPESYEAVMKAVADVVTEKRLPKEQQAQVDAMTSAINQAIYNLVLIIEPVAELPYKSYTYNGNVRTPKPTVYTDSSKTKKLNPETDYDVTYSSGRKNVGTYKVKVTLKGKYSGSAETSFKIVAKSIASATVSVPKTSYAYTGKEIKPTVTVKDGTKKLVSGTDYTVNYTNNKNVGTATVTVTGKGNYKGTAKTTFKITKAILKTQITIPKSAYTYTGSAIKPTVTVKDGTKKLTVGTNYTVKYTNNKNVGTATITITGKGYYTGTATKTFKINPKGTKLSSVTALSRGFNAKWTKQATQTTGYQILYSTKKDFSSGNKQVTVSGTNNISKKITGLKAKTTYYVKIRTFKTVGSQKYYSDWSGYKAVKTLK
ncbi:MAG: hypothetical protein IKF90_11785 [Parasporobacterium sp.]|nr:hypothetical protein [Parasporobacterium sp.]